MDVHPQDPDGPCNGDFVREDQCPAPYAEPLAQAMTGLCDFRASAEKLIEALGCGEAILLAEELRTLREKYFAVERKLDALLSDRDRSSHTPFGWIVGRLRASLISAQLDVHERVEMLCCKNNAP